MLYEFMLPDIGEGVVEAEVQKWLVKPGDEVREDDPLVEVMTDKATVTIPSPHSGRILKLHCEQGQVAKVREPLLAIEVEAIAQAEGPELPADGVARPISTLAAVKESRLKSLATPAVRAFARELGIDINTVRGSGPGGRVTKEDLAQSTQSLGERPLPRADAVGSVDEVIPMRGVRRRIAERMAHSKRTAAHFTFVEQVDVTELGVVKARVGAAARERGVKVTFLPFIVKAVVAALKRHPWLNATLDETRGEIRLRREYHIGIASATEQGLLVPVVRHADRLSLLALAQEIDRLASESKEGQARAEDMGDSTFTITSLGAQGGLFATPIINHPEVAILGIHRIRPTPLVRDGQIVARDVMHVSLSFDHRVVDGHVGAAFAYTLIGYLEDPNLLFMEMV
ncbi:MAG TPA: dihydrolipoamide acetyltransferase family protein [Anaeromyxobacteraceae bacterium]|nr:dihydrolipoamide acetyltransferase family protein [Anaeromyxobacteraceae bacterium]